MVETDSLENCYALTGIEGSNPSASAIKTALSAVFISTLDAYPLGVYSGYMYDSKQKIARRLKIIEGQVRGLQEMLEKGTYCVDVITQTSAVKQALSGVEDSLMESHLGTCVVDQMKKGKEGPAIKEILKVYRLKRK